MAIALKGMRKISVHKEIFLWKIRRKISHDEAHNVEYAIPVQHSGGGQVLFVFVGFTRAYGYGNSSPASVTPGMIRPLIETAIGLGWQYNAPGNAISLVNGALQVDSKNAKDSAG
ncbi:MAG: hypothetical protein ABWY06_22120 [Pseudomonas sp.]|uniref:hypothetical protein n=1 Tax=Pseudomonas sp. TaxID=306 RepID=UPI003397A208